MEYRRHSWVRSTAGVTTVVWLLAGLLLLGGCASPKGPPKAPTAEPYLTGPPDQLVITILPEPIIERTVTIRPDGMISIDLVGDVPASGRTTQEIASDIEKRILRFKRNAKVTVALQRSLSAQVTVLGEVIRRTTFPLERETRVVEAIGLVGGPNILAAKNRIRVVRFRDGATQVYRVNLSAIENGDLRTNMLLEAGDVVVVPSSVSATIGHFLGNLFYPLQRIIGLGSRTTLTVFTGGAGAGF
jgi:polysaccharide export outer membrane protein